MKLSRVQLRGLINEAIQGRRIGDPLFVAPAARRRTVSEAEGTFRDPPAAADDVVYAASDAMRSYLELVYDAGDPSIEMAGGKDAFDRQASAALADFEARMLALVEEVQEKLIQGEYVR